MSWVDGFSKVRLRPGDEPYDWIDDKMHRSICAHDGNIITKYNIVKVYKVYNSDLWENYCDKRDDLYYENGRRCVEEKRLFHGTENAEQIIREGFDMSYADPEAMFGKGIYFSDLSSKSNQYTCGWKNRCRNHGERMCTDCVRSMLVCRVALGRKFKAHDTLHRLPRGYDSVLALPGPDFLEYPEYVVYDENQVFPGYLVKYTIKQVRLNGGGGRSRSSRSSYRC